MRKWLLAGAAVLVLAGSSVVYAQYRPDFRMNMMRLNPDDMSAFADARIAAVKAGLRLTPDQEKLWPPVEAAVRDFAKLRIDRANARMKAQDASGGQQTPDDPVARLRERADNMTASAAGLKKIADAADPLYKTLDEGQKRRLAMLTRHRGPFGGGEDGPRRGFMDRGMDRFHGDRSDHNGGPDRDGRL